MGVFSDSEPRYWALDAPWLPRWWQAQVYRYQLSSEDAYRALEHQGYACGLCSMPFTQNVPGQLDHDHRCCRNKRGPLCGACNRGFLCGPCNMLIGHYEYRVNRLYDILDTKDALTQWCDGRLLDRLESPVPPWQVQWARSTYTAHQMTVMRHLGVTGDVVDQAVLHQGWNCHCGNLLVWRHWTFWCPNDQVGCWDCYVNSMKENQERSV